MIDFAKITKTLDGYDCHYFGTRESYGTKLHCFGVMTDHGVQEKCYDEQGRRLTWESGAWNLVGSGSVVFAIIKPPKIVEVTRWAALFKGDTTGDGYLVVCYQDEPIQKPDMLCKIHQTLRFEVPND